VVREPRELHGKTGAGPIRPPVRGEVGRCREIAAYAEGITRAVERKGVAKAHTLVTPFRLPCLGE
jgi:hypothetical protein